VRSDPLRPRSGRLSTGSSRPAQVNSNLAGSVVFLQPRRVLLKAF
jgi:hypothetical protein